MSYEGWIDSGQGFSAWKKAMEAKRLELASKGNQVFCDMAADPAGKTISWASVTEKNEHTKPSYYARTGGRLTEKTADIHESIDAAFDRLSKDATGAE